MKSKERTVLGYTNNFLRQRPTWAALDRKGTERLDGHSTMNLLQLKQSVKS
jgi:hypothetical protein